MAPAGPWSCCFRPKVAEHDQGTDALRATPREDVDTKAKCIEDSANANGFAKLQLDTVQAPEPVEEDAEEFGSPTSSYATCFSEEDPGELSARSQRRLGFLGADEATAASGTAEREVPVASGITEAAAPAAAVAAPQTHAAAVYSSSIQQLQQEELQQSMHWLDTDLGRPQTRRDRLPQHNGVIPGVGLWSLLRDWIGKDLHKLTLPTHLNEPLSDLQRRVEAFEYSELLDEAATKPKHSLERLICVAAFASSVYSTIQRTQKPFKNMQNSTYELVYPEKGLRAIGEKVRHIPMVVVVHAEGRGWQFDANDEFHMELWGNHARIRPAGEMYATFHDGDEYCWAPTYTYINNILIGKRYLDHRGPFHVTCLQTNDSFQCKISEPMLGKSQHEIKGHLERNGRKVEGVRLFGRWHHSVHIAMPDGSQRQLWKANPPYKHACHRHNFPLWTTHLNDLTPEIRGKLPPTDDRLRPDMRLFEHGFYEEANDEKLRLEEKQRQERNAVEAAGKPWESRWFQQVEKRRGLETWRYKGGKDCYWKARESGNWEGCRDIYGPGPGDQQPPKLLY